VVGEGDAGIGCETCGVGGGRRDGAQQLPTLRHAVARVGGEEGMQDGRAGARRPSDEEGTVDDLVLKAGVLAEQIHQLHADLEQTQEESPRHPPAESMQRSLLLEGGQEACESIERGRSGEVRVTESLLDRARAIERSTPLHAGFGDESFEVEWLLGHGGDPRDLSRVRSAYPFRSRGRRPTHPGQVRKRQARCRLRARISSRRDAGSMVGVSAGSAERSAESATTRLLMVGSRSGQNQR